MPYQPDSDTSCISRRTIMKGFFTIAASVAIPMPARADPATATIIINAAQAVVRFLGSDSATRSATMMAFEGINKHLVSINLGLQEAIRAIHDLRFFVAEEFRRAEHEEMNRKIFAIYTSLVDEKFKRLARIDSDPVSASMFFKEEAEKLYDRIRIVRNEGFFLRPDQYRSAAMTLCIAQSCEMELCIELERDDVELQSVAQAYRDWLMGALDPDKAGSLSHVRHECVMEYGRLRDRIKDRPGHVLLDSLQRGDELDCILIEAKIGSTLFQNYATLIVELDAVETRYGLPLWKPGSEFFQERSWRWSFYENGQKRSKVGFDDYQNPFQQCGVNMLPAGEGAFAAARAGLVRDWKKIFAETNEIRWKIVTLLAIEEAARAAIAMSDRVLEELASSRVPL